MRGPVRLCYSADMNTAEPLQPPPRWVYTSGAGWHDSTALVTNSRVADPSTFVLGYEKGAYALAKRLDALIDGVPEWEQGMVLIMRELMRYRSGAAHPVRGWEHEPKRS